MNRRTVSGNMLCVIALLLLSYLPSGLSGDTGEFPYVWTPEAELPKWQAHRVEEAGPVGLHAPLRTARYLRKLRQKKFSAPVEEIDYFEAQKAVLAAVAALPATGLAHTSLAFAGDIMWIRDNWSGFVDDSLLQYLNGHDVVIANLETVISKSHRVPRYWPLRRTVNSPPELLTSFRRADGASTFSALSVASNHALDHGDDGMLDTLRFLDQEGIPHSGVSPDKNSPRWELLERNGIRIGFYAATYGVNGAAERDTGLRFNLLPGVAAFHGPPPPDLSEVRGVLSAMLAAEVDVRIISLRWGHEFEYYPTPQQMQVAREIVAAGADVIIGHHSHAQQPLEVCFVNGYEQQFAPEIATRDDDKICRIRSGNGQSRKALVIYSPGNFVTAMSGFLNRLGAIHTLKLTKDAAGRVDWTGPDHRFVYNAPRDPRAGGRRVLFLQDWVDRRCFRTAGCSDRDMEQLEFVRSLPGYREVITSSYDRSPDSP